MTLEPQPGGAASGPDEGRAAELDEFLGRAVDRQIAEQQALRETLTALTQAVNALSAPGARLDPDDLADRVREAVRAAVDPLIGEIRTLADDITQKVRAAGEGRASPGGGEELTQLTEQVGTVSMDIEGIAQALIDLNAGLRDWATGVDRTIASMRDTVERVSEISEERFATALEDTGAQPAVVSDDVSDDEIGGEFVEARPVVPARVEDEPDLEQRIRESIELSLYLADQIEEFDRVLAGMGDLPAKLEGVIAQGMRRTLAARSKLDSEANATLDETLTLLDSYVDRMSATVETFSDSEETLRKLGLGQVELASRLDSLYEAVHDLASGGGSRAASLTRPAPKRKPKLKAAAKPKKAQARKVGTKKEEPKRKKRTTRKTSQSDSTD